MKISVIIPCYNVEGYIEKCIRALSLQTFQNFDAIFVDDCSGDNSAARIEQYIQQYGLNGRLIRTPHNMGPSGARKLGIDCTDAEYIAFCDSDDWYEESFLEKMYAATDNEKHDLVFCNYNLVYGSGRILPKTVISENGVYAPKDMLTLDIDGLCLGIYRRKIFEDLVFPDIRHGEDMAVIPLLMCRSKSAGVVCEPLYHYFQRAGSLSTTQTKNMVNDLLTSFDYIYNHMDLSRYREETEYIGIRNVLYGALLNLLKTDHGSKRACGILNGFEEKFPDWPVNQYIRKLPVYKKVYLLGARTHMIWFMRLLSKLHTVLTK